MKMSSKSTDPRGSYDVMKVLTCIKTVLDISVFRNKRKFVYVVLLIQLKSFVVAKIKWSSKV